MAEKIFGIGLNKTGTTTLGLALELLGYTNHISNSLSLLKAFSQGDLKKVFKASELYDNFEDWPWPLMYKQLFEKYEDSKFILTVRKDEITWYKSLCKHSERTGPTRMRKIVYGKFMPHNYQNLHIEFYKHHIENVKEFFKEVGPDRLLIVCWENGDDWEAICQFLNKEVPDQPLPRSNSAEQDFARRRENLMSFFKPLMAQIFIKLRL